MENLSKIQFAELFQKRTKSFCIRAIKLFQELPKTSEALIIGKQFLRAATSVASNYRAVCRARSKAEFFSKLSIVVEEADESVFWLELIAEAKILEESKVKELMAEAKEILFVLAKARKNTYKNQCNH